MASKPTQAEIRALVMREAQARIELQTARARAHIRLSKRDEKATFHQCRAYAIAVTKTKYEAYEQARADLLSVAYAVNGTLDLMMQEHSFGT